MTPIQIDFGKPERVVGIDLGTTNSLVAYMDLPSTPASFRARTATSWCPASLR